jgi:hypothetical protein
MSPPSNKNPTPTLRSPPHPLKTTPKKYKHYFVMVWNLMYLCTFYILKDHHLVCLLHLTPVCITYTGMWLQIAPFISTKQDWWSSVSSDTLKYIKWLSHQSSFILSTALLTHFIVHFICTICLFFSALHYSCNRLIVIRKRMYKTATSW